LRSFLAARQCHRSARIRQVGGWGAFFADENRQASDAVTKNGLQVGVVRR